jgi:hypothetical protein
VSGSIPSDIPYYFRGLLGLVSSALGCVRFDSLGYSLLFDVSGSIPSDIPYYFQGMTPRPEITW